MNLNAKTVLEQMKMRSVQTSILSGQPVQQGGQAGPGSGSGSGGSGPGAGAQFQCPRRPNHGVEGRAILLRANHFAVRIPGGTIQHYQVDVQPDKCPRRVNRYGSGTDGFIVD